MAMARQTWDEVRHAQLGTELSKSLRRRSRRVPRHARGGRLRPATRPQAPLRPGHRRLEAGTAKSCATRVISLSITNVALEGGGPRPVQGHVATWAASQRRPDGTVYDYNWADEVTHTAIGDYFVKALCEDNPEEEERALRAHAMVEGMRERLSGQQTAEISEFFAEEIERGTAALSGSGQ